MPGTGPTVAGWAQGALSAFDEPLSQCTVAATSPPSPTTTRATASRRSTLRTDRSSVASPGAEPARGTGGGPGTRGGRGTGGGETLGSAEELTYLLQVGGERRRMSTTLTGARVVERQLEGVQERAVDSERGPGAT